MSRFRRRSDSSPDAERAGRDSDGAPTIIAELKDGPLEGRAIQAETVEGRPPKTIDVESADGGTCRYCLAQWSQSGRSAAYTFLYRV
jgi:hypothetical protein